MKKLSAEKMLNIIEYEKVRNDYRNDIIKYKKNRRIKLGPNIAFVCLWIDVEFKDGI